MLIEDSWDTVGTGSHLLLNHTSVPFAWTHVLSTRLHTIYQLVCF